MIDSLSNYVVNKTIDQFLRAQAGIAPTSVYVGLSTCTAGVRANGITYAASATMTVLAADGFYHKYLTSAGGISNASTVTFPGLANETVIDGTVTWVEQTTGMKSGAAVAEPTLGVGSYARQIVVSSLVNWAGTQGAGTTTTSSGTSGLTSNNSPITFPSPTADWVAAPGVAWGIALYDAASGGNLLYWGPLGSPASVVNSASAINFANTQLQLQLL